MLSQKPSFLGNLFGRHYIACYCSVRLALSVDIFRIAFLYCQAKCVAVVSQVVFTRYGVSERERERDGYRKRAKMWNVM
jgi:hypothetical protein